MREFAEFRIPEDRAARFLAPDMGTLLGTTVRKVVVATDEPGIERIRQAYHALRRSGEEFFTTWIPHRRYTRRELESAELFRLSITAAFEPAGEECGTTYDRSTACRVCGVGRRQTSELVLDLRRAPKKDFARTIGEEWIVSQRVAEMILREQLTGVELWPVRHKARYQDDALTLADLPSGRELIERAGALGIHTRDWEFTVWLNSPEQSALLHQAVEENVARLRIKHGKRTLPMWYQLIVTAPPVDAAPPTRFGMHIFDEDPHGVYRCSACNWAGLNLLSELHVSRDEWSGTDFAITRQAAGANMNLLVPAPEVLISSRARKVLEAERVSGFKLEVAYLV